MFTAGVSNSLTLNSKTFVRSVVAFSGRSYTYDSDRNIGTKEIPIDRTWKTDVLDYTLKGSLILNRKFNARHNLKTGLIYEMTWDESFMGWNSDTLFNWYSDPGNPNYQSQEYEHTYVDEQLSAGTFQAFGSWSYQVAESLTLNTGLHFIQFYLNKNYSLEPRLGLNWDINHRHSLSGGFGIHSRKESMTLYSGRKYLPNGEYIQANMDLELRNNSGAALVHAEYTTGEGFAEFTWYAPIAPADAWEQQVWDISAYDEQTVYLGIQCVSEDAFIFMLDDLLIFSIAMITLQEKMMTAKYTSWSNLIGGLIMLIIGILLIFKPGWLMFG